LSRSSRSSPRSGRPLPDGTPRFLRGERRSQDTRVARTPTGLDQDRAEALARLAREEPHHADGGPLVEDGEQDGVVVDGAHVQALLGALVEQDGELAFTQQTGERGRRAERTGREGSDRHGVERAGGAGDRERLAAALDQEHGGGARVPEEAL